MPESANEHLDVLKAYLEARPAVRSILDVGMGRGNYGWFLRNVVHYEGKLTGMDVWAPYVVGEGALSGGNRTYYDGGIVVMDMRDASSVMADLHPDVIFAFDVIEHVTKEEGIRVLRAMQRAANVAVLVASPIVPYAQGPVHGNPFEEHRHDWTVEEFLALGSEMRDRGTVTGLFELPGGRCDRRMSVLLNTARSDDAFPKPKPTDGPKNILRSLADDLAAQTFLKSDFELVITDGLFAKRGRTFERHDYPFRILHVPPKETAMTREGRPAICAYKNTAIAHARGELLLTVDDGSVLDSRFLERTWLAWGKRHCLSALAYAVRPDGTPMVGEVYQDSRRIYLGAEGQCVGPLNGNVMTPPGQGFMAFPLEAAVRLNGYDEMFDGARGLEDMDFGARLQGAGYRIGLDQAHRVGLYEHGGWDPALFADADDGSQGVIKCAQTTFRIRGCKEIRANARPWTDEEWARVTPRCVHLDPTENRFCTLFPPRTNPCPYVGRCSDREHPGLRAQRENPPVFDLMELRRDNGIA